MVNLDDKCSRHFTWRQLIECGETWERLAAAGTPCWDMPMQEATWSGLALVAETILDPVVAEFGPVEMTYCFSPPSLFRHIGRRIAPKLDQHAGSELNRLGELICRRQGQAVDFRVPKVTSSDVARFIGATLPFDRLYYFGDDRALHVSAGPAESRLAYSMLRGNGGALVPRRIVELSMIQRDPVHVAPG